MGAELQIIDLVDDSASRIDSVWLGKAEALHRQLRPDLPAAYAVRLGQIVANGGRMTLVVEGQDVVAISIWRVIENTYEGRRLYVDDLVTESQRRSRGHGSLLLEWLENRARLLGCSVLALDSGVQRSRAHRFYFREGMHISAYSFRKALT